MGKRVDLNINLKRKISWHYTDGYCCLCSTKIGFFEEEGFVGEFAHIIDLQKATTRYETDKSIGELNSKENVIILCPNCHTKIDKESEKYSTAYLKEIKDKYETNIIVGREYSNPEYMNIFNYIFNDLKSRYNSYSIRDTYFPITVKEKMNKNSLLEINDIIETGLSHQTIFKEYLDSIAHLERVELRKMVIDIYLKQSKKNDISNVDKFINMIKELIGNNIQNYLYAIIILTYYFEECDVFEV